MMGGDVPGGTIEREPSTPIETLALEAVNAHKTHLAEKEGSQERRDAFSTRHAAYKTLYDAYDKQENKGKDETDPTRKSPAQLRVELNNILDKTAKENGVPTPPAELYYPVYKVEYAELQETLGRKGQTLNSSFILS